LDWEIDPAKVRWPFEKPFENFRLLDPLSRIVAIAVEALGGDLDPDSAIVLATRQGCLWTDLRFEQSRHGDLRPGLFPYTLPSAPIAAVAIRHGLHGPSLCLVGEGAGLMGDGRAEAELLIESGEAPAVVLCTGDVVPPDTVGMTALYLTP